MRRHADRVRAGLDLGPEPGLAARRLAGRGRGARLHGQGARDGGAARAGQGARRVARGRHARVLAARPARADRHAPTEAGRGVAHARRGAALAAGRHRHVDGGRESLLHVRRRGRRDGVPDQLRAHARGHPRGAAARPALGQAGLLRGRGERARGTGHAARGVPEPRRDRRAARNQRGHAVPTLRGGDPDAPPPAGKAAA